MKYSTAANNLEGLQEEEIKARYLKEKPAGRYYKHRPRCQLSSEEIKDIVEAYDKGILT